MKDTTYLKRELNYKIEIAKLTEDFEWLDQLNNIKKHFDS